MDYFQVLEKRRSIRKYKDQPIESEKVEKVIKAALRAPTSKNLQPCEFLVVTNPKLLQH